MVVGICRYWWIAQSWDFQLFCRMTAIYILIQSGSRDSCNLSIEGCVYLRFSRADSLARFDKRLEPKVKGGARAPVPILVRLNLGLIVRRTGI